MDRRLLVISIDSMIEDDLRIIAKLDTLGDILGRSSVVWEMTSTYPTLTHSIHSSIITGCYPDRHGVISNERFIPGNLHAPWYDKASDLKVATLPDLCKSMGYTTASVCWPLTVGADMTYVLHRAGIRVPLEQKGEAMRALSTEGLVDEVEPFTGKCWDELPHFEASDRFSCRAAAYLYKEHKPDVMYVHLILVDHMRHQKGVYGEHIEQAYQFLDIELKVLWDTLEQEGLLDKTIVNITSDHGHLPVERVVSLNRFFKDNGLLCLKDNGELDTWQAYAHTCALSAQIYLSDSSVAERVYSLLDRNSAALGISRVFTAEQAENEYLLRGGFSFVVETDGHTAFSSDYNAPLVGRTGDEDYRYSVATHGHLPTVGPQPCFILYNPFASRRIELQRGRIIDQAPTLAKLMGIPMSDCDGECIKELCEDSKWI